jgi:hypothetical protein
VISHIQKCFLFLSTISILLVSNLAAITFERPKIGLNLGCVEKLAGHGNHAVYEIGLDHVLPNFAFTGRAGGHGPVGHYKSCNSVGGDVMCEVLNPN